jgi:flagellar hook assembly protein FlgD
VVVTAYELAPNYPNPFSPPERGFAGNVGTEITFALPEAGKVSLHVYSTTGQLVRTLVDREMETGRHQAQWNGRNEAGQVVAAGIYLYRITVLGRNGEAVFTETRRLTFLK